MLLVFSFEFASIVQILRIWAWQSPQKVRTLLIRRVRWPWVCLKWLNSIPAVPTFQEGAAGNWRLDFNQEPKRDTTKVID